MNVRSSKAKDVYYTSDHEWIDFQGSVAFAGICRFKLTGFKQIQQLSWTGDPTGFKKRGEIVANLKYNEYVITVHMPVEGKILEINSKLLSGNLNLLLDCAETTGWLFRLSPAQPHDRTGLLLPKQYQLNGKNKYAK